jgi:hypothetical protein
LSPIEKKLLVARREVHSLVQAGQMVKDAVTRVAREMGLGYDQLYNSYAGTRGGTRRAIKRAKK